METLQTHEDLNRFFELQIESIKKTASEEARRVAEEIVERELGLLEFNLFLSSAGKEHLDRATNAAQEIRRLKKEGKIDLTEYEEIAEEF